MKELSLLFFAAVLAVVVVLAFSSCSIVPPGHRGVMVTLGTVHPEALPEGVAWKAPFLASVHHVSVQQVTMQGQAACFSSDLQTVMVTYAVLYRVPVESVVTLYQNYSGEPFEALLRPRLDERLKAVTARYTAENVVKSREEIRVETLAETREAVGSLLEVVDIALANIDLSDQLEKAIEDKMVKEQESLAKKYELDKANKQAEIDIITARGEAQAMVERAKPITENPLVLLIDVLKKWDGKMPQTLVVGSDVNPAMLLPTKPSP